MILASLLQFCYESCTIQMLSIPRKMMKQLTRIYDSPRKILKDCFMTLWILFGFSLDSIWILFGFFDIQDSLRDFAIFFQHLSGFWKMLHDSFCYSYGDYFGIQNWDSSRFFKNLGGSQLTSFTKKTSRQSSYISAALRNNDNEIIFDWFKKLNWTDWWLVIWT